MKKIFFQFSKFAIVGCTNTALDFIVYFSLTRLFTFWHEQKILATTIAFVIANINSYILNKFWTFQNKEKKYHIQYSKFLIISLVGLVLTDTIFSFAHYSWQQNDIIAKLLPIPAVLLWNFIANKFWTFRK